jgi:predicted type IV restriction endonuclease
VSVHRVDYELTPENINKQLLDSKIYKGTEYLILNNNNAWSVVRIGKTPKHSLFWLVTGVEILSLPKDTVFKVDPNVDVLNRNSMAKFAEKYPGKTVIVQGMYEHVSFVKDERFIELLVLDVQPPKPDKLTTMVGELLKFRSFPRPIKTEKKIIDIEQILKETKTKIVILPCQASVLKTNKEILYLDERPEIKASDKENITLIGCDLSLKIFRELYRFTPNFINICPMKFASELPQAKPVLIKCCNVKSFECQNNLYLVPWGVTYKDLEDALNQLVEDST